jgi:hypothetical protein
MVAADLNLDHQSSQVGWFNGLYCAATSVVFQELYMTHSNSGANSLKPVFQLWRRLFSVHGDDRSIHSRAS